MPEWFAHHDQSSGFPFVFGFVPVEVALGVVLHHESSTSFEPRLIREQPGHGMGHIAEQEFADAC